MLSLLVVGGYTNHIRDVSSDFVLIAACDRNHSGFARRGSSEMKTDCSLQQQCIAQNQSAVKLQF
jgi:hypothetical protein